MNDITNILLKMDKIDKNTISEVRSQSNPMHDILTNLNKVMLTESDTMKPEGGIKKQMPGNHTMAKATDTKHPANEFLVGGEEGDVPADKDAQLDEEVDDSGWGGELVEDLKLILQDFGDMDGDMSQLYNAIKETVEQYDDGDEFNEARGRLQGNDRENDDWEPAEDPGQKYWSDNIGVDDDEPDLEHDLEKADYFNDPMNKRHYESKTNEMDDSFDRSGPWDDDEEREVDVDPGFDGTDDEMEESYDSETMSFRKMPVTEDDIEEDTISPKQSFADVFKSMEESNEEKTANLEKELFTELSEPEELTKAENGKYNLRDTKA